MRQPFFLVQQYVQIYQLKIMFSKKLTNNYQEKFVILHSLATPADILVGS